MYLVFSLFVLRAGYWICLCQFLIIAYLFTLVYKLYRRFVLLVDKMADQNLSGCQPRKFADMAMEKICLFSIESEMFAFCNCCSNVVTADSL